MEWLMAVVSDQKCPEAPVLIEGWRHLHGGSMAPKHLQTQVSSRSKADAMEGAGRNPMVGAFPVDGLRKMIA